MSCTVTDGTGMPPICAASQDYKMEEVLVVLEEIQQESGEQSRLNGCDGLARNITQQERPATYLSAAVDLARSVVPTF